MIWECVGLPWLKIYEFVASEMPSCEENQTTIIKMENVIAYFQINCRASAA